MPKPDKRTKGSDWQGQPVRKQTAFSPPTAQKKTTSGSEPSWAGETPSWRLGRLETCDPFGWHRLRPRKFWEIIAKLQCFESMTWSEILVQSKKQNHSVPIFKLEKSAQERIEALRLRDLDEVVSLHLTGTERIWGILEGRVLKLLWWDPNHQICPSILKHT